MSFHLVANLKFTKFHNDKEKAYLWSEKLLLTENDGHSLV